MIRYLYVFINLTTAALLCSKSTLAEQWYELTSDNFLLLTNTKPEVAWDTLERLEKFRFVVGAITGIDLNKAKAPPLKLVAFNSLTRYKKFSKLGRSAGFYQVTPYGAQSVFALPPKRKTLQVSGLQIVFHEYVHHVIHQFSEIRYPRWYDEGFAEYLATMEFDGKKAIIGSPNIPRITMLRGAPKWLKSRKLIEEKGRYFQRRDENLLLYAQGWLIVHMMQTNEQYSNGIVDYLKAINDDIVMNDAFEGSFGTNYVGLDRDLRRYWQHGRFATQLIDFTEQMPDFPIAVKELSKVQADAALWETRFLNYGVNSNKKRKKASVAFQALLSAGIDTAKMNSYLAEIALQDDDINRAQQHILALRQSDPADVRGAVLAAKLYQAQALQNATSIEKQLTLKNMYQEAIALDLHYVPGLIAYVDFILESQLDVSKDVSQAVKRIRTLLPDLDLGRQLEVELLIKSGAFTEARQKLKIMEEWASGREDKRFVKAKLKQINDAAID